MKRVALIAALAAILGAPCSAETLTYVDLVNRLTDLERLAALPVPGETCAQASSYDRASRYDAATGKYVDWDANGDGGGYIRQEGDSIVIAEMEGPGCIWRTWSALAQEGHVRMYLDGAEEPVVDLPFDGWFNGKNKPFTYPALVHTASQGRNNYVPIPFQKSCKIVADKGWGAYYQFTYTTFPKGTVVPTFTRDLKPEELAALERADALLSGRLGSDPAHRDNQRELRSRVSVKPGRTETVVRLDGPAAVTGLRVAINGRDYTEEELRNVALRISWDGEKSPSVWAPIGDFFGTGPGLAPYASLPMGVTDRDAYCYWYMPFARSAVIQLTNEGKKTFATDFSITVAPLTRPLAGLGRFHAKWHRDAFLPPEKERWIDWTILKTQGSGRFCGVALEVWNPRGGWWGEGDEKWHVDGEKFPSTIGTGSEDYFGYAWCDPRPFQNAYHNQTRNDNTDNASHISVNRWHITDNIPFSTSFEGFIEKYYSNTRPTLYAATAYWYLSPDGVDPYGAVKVKDRTNWYVQAVPVKRPEGWFEGETAVVTKTAGTAAPQSLGDRWSAESQLWWTDAKPGDVLTIEMPLKKAGKYELEMAFTKAIDYGIVQLALDGEKLGGPIDFYNDGIQHTGPVSFGIVDLKAGKHVLTATIVGANEKAVKSYMFGLDYVRFKKPGAK